MSEKQERPRGEFGCALFALLGAIFLVFVVLPSLMGDAFISASGTVVDRLGRPLAGVRVRLRTEHSGPGEFSDTYRTNSRGEFDAMRSFRPAFGHWNGSQGFVLQFERPGYVSQGLKINRDHEHLRIMLSKAEKPPEIRGSKGGEVTGFPADFLEQDLFDDMVFSADGNTLVVVSHDTGVVTLCDLTTGKKETLASPYGGKVLGTKVVYSSDGSLLATAYPDLGIVISDVGNRKERRRTPLDHEKVGDMVFADGQRTLVAALEKKDGKCLVGHWDLSSGELSRVVHLGRVSEPVISPDGRHGVLTDEHVDGVVFDLATGAKRFRLEAGGGWVFSRDGSTVVACKHTNLSLRDSSSGAVTSSFEFTIDFPFYYDPRLSVSADGKLLAVPAYPAENCAALISLETGKLLDEIECGPHVSICTLARLSPDGRMLATQTALEARGRNFVEPVTRLWKLPASWPAK